MNKKTKQILAAVAALVIVVGGMFAWRSLRQNHGEKDIHIQIIADEKTVYDRTVDTDAGTLADLLKEMQENQEIQLSYSNTAYGMYIQAMGTDELLSEDPASGKYWTYTSENNAQCVKNGFCDGADSLIIEDGDTFVFTLAAFE